MYLSIYLTSGQHCETLDGQPFPKTQPLKWRSRFSKDLSCFYAKRAWDLSSPVSLKGLAPFSVVTTQIIMFSHSVHPACIPCLQLPPCSPINWAWKYRCSLQTQPPLPEGKQERGVYIKCCCGSRAENHWARTWSSHLVETPAESQGKSCPSRDWLNCESVRTLSSLILILDLYHMLALLWSRESAVRMLPTDTVWRRLALSHLTL